MKLSFHFPAWRERFVSPLSLHLVGFAALLVLAAALAIRLGFDWAAVNRNSNDALTGKQLQLKTLEIEATPLRGIEQRVAKSSEQMQAFFARRIPPNYSSISSRIGELQVASGVRLSRVQYTQGAPIAGLAEITLDAGISGNYPAIVRFINSIERDQTFFIIRAMSLTSQQGGLVTLRLRLSTWLRSADAAASGLPPTPPSDEALPEAPAGERGGE